MWTGGYDRKTGNGRCYLPNKTFPQLMDDPNTDQEIQRYLTSYRFIYNPEKNGLVKRDNGTE